MSNIIDAIVNLVLNASAEIEEGFLGNNRANNMGDAFEEYIKDLFSGAINMEKTKKLEQYSKTFSWLGNKTNPPDCMLRNGDAIEVKKIENENSAIALNSSYPKQKLSCTSHMISKHCKEAENWEEKDLLYIVGFVLEKRLKHLCMVYGEDYCACSETYEKIRGIIKNGIEKIHNIELTESKELGKLNRIDPLGITYLRIRGMWGIENPWKVFDYVYSKDRGKDFNFMCIINQKKWEGLPNTNQLLELQDKGLQILEVRIKNPDNPSQLREAKMIVFSK